MPQSPTSGRRTPRRRRCPRASRTHRRAPDRAERIGDEILTGNGKCFTGRFGPQPVEVQFDRICRENGISHRTTTPRSPTTTGKVERCHPTQTVFGEGTPGALAILVGEQPGDHEDRRAGRSSVRLGGSWARRVHCSGAPNEPAEPYLPRAARRTLSASPGGTTVSGSRRRPSASHTPTRHEYRGGQVGHVSKCASSGPRSASDSSSSR